MKIDLKSKPVLELFHEVRMRTLKLCEPLRKADQKVHSTVLDKSYIIRKHELIWTELSKKYELKEIEELGKAAGLELVKHFTDSEDYFSDSLFKIK